MFGIDYVKSLALTTVFSALLAATGANAQGSVAIGRLTCGVKGGVAFVIGSTRELRCVFRVTPDDPGERYEGRIKKFGLDVGITDKALITWLVLAPTREIGPGALAGHYYGVAADASVGVGGGANVLLGGSDRSISLQPVSVQGQTGLNAAVAVADVELFPYYEGK
jgi:uncharacterized protein DUF992